LRQQDLPGDNGTGDSREKRVPRYVAVARIHEIPPGRSKVIREGDLQIALFNLGDIFYAIDNICPHSGGPLSKGELQGEVVKCPWHGWQFNIKTGLSPIIPEVCVKIYQIRVEGGQVLVDLESP